MNKKIKILHLSQPTGGVKTYVAQVLTQLSGPNFEFVVIAPANDDFEEFCRQHQVKYYQVDLHRGNNPVKNVRALAQIVRILRKEKPDLIHAHSAKGGFLGRLASSFIKDSKVIYTPHAFSYMPFKGVKRMIFFFLELIVKRWTTVLLAISYSEASRAINEVGFKKEHVEVIPNAISIGTKKLTLHDGVNIRMIGRLTAQKNPMLFLEIAKELLKKYKFLKFAILGEGIHDELTGNINQFIDNNQLHECVEIKKWGDSSTSDKFLAETDVFVMTSIFEGLPFSLLEAMSMGIPCVVSQVDGNIDVIQNMENGFSCITKADFCSKIEMLINDEVKRREIGRSAAEHIEKNHNLEIIRHKLSDFYARIYRKS